MDSSKLDRKGGWLLGDCLLAGGVSAGVFAITGAALGLKVALVNLLPNLILAIFWQGVLVRFYPTRRAALTILFVFATARAELTIAGWLAPFQSLALAGCAALILIPWTKVAFTKTYFSTFYWSVLILLFNSITHLSYSSPVGYPIYPHNNSQYLLSIGSVNYLVMADYFHWECLDQIFRFAEFDPQHSVVLRRFFYDYCLSLLPYPSGRWFEGVCLNVVFWICSITACIRLGETLKFTPGVIKGAMLSLASAFGFVFYVGQPIPYLSSYAFGFLSTFLVFRLANSPSARGSQSITYAMIAMTVATYDMYPLILSLFGYLLYKKKFFEAGVLAAIQLAVPMIWSVGILGNVVKTFGATYNIHVFADGFGKWRQILLNADLTEAWVYFSQGLLNLFYGQLLVGIPAVVLAVVFWKRDATNQDRDLKREFALFSCILCFLTVCAYAALAPGMTMFSMDGVLPRISYYPFFISIFCLIYLAEAVHPRVKYVIAGGSLFLAQIDFFGSDLVAMFFNFGLY